MSITIKKFSFIIGREVKRLQCIAYFISIHLTRVIVDDISVGINVNDVFKFSRKKKPRKFLSLSKECGTRVLRMDTFPKTMIFWVNFLIKWKLLYNQISIDRYRYLQRKHVLEKYCQGVVDQAIPIYGSSGAINTCKHYTYNTGRRPQTTLHFVKANHTRNTVPRAPQGNNFVYRANASSKNCALRVLGCIKIACVF